MSGTRGLGGNETRRRKWRGKKGELQLVHYLKSLGYNAERSAMSGIGRNKPDVYACTDNILIAFEVKCARTKYAKIVKNQILKLKRFLLFFSYYPHRIAVLVVRFPYHGWIFHKVEGAEWNRNFLKFTRESVSNWDPEKPLG